jgi:hypothetical protein
MTRDEIVEELRQKLRWGDAVVHLQSPTAREMLAALTAAPSDPRDATIADLEARLAEERTSTLNQCRAAIKEAVSLLRFPSSPFGDGAQALAQYLNNSFFAAAIRSLPAQKGE